MNHKHYAMLPTIYLLPVVTMQPKDLHGELFMTTWLRMTLALSKWLDGLPCSHVFTWRKFYQCRCSAPKMMREMLLAIMTALACMHIDFISFLLLYN